LYTQNGCGGCHTLGTISAGIVGPALTNIGTQAASREAGKSAEEYLKESILNPNAFISSQCPSGPCPESVMPSDWGAKLSEEQINDLVAFLLAQK
jgi:cytochrome c551/c552